MHTFRALHDLVLRAFLLLPYHTVCSTLTIINISELVDNPYRTNQCRGWSNWRESAFELWSDLILLLLKCSCTSRVTGHCCSYPWHSKSPCLPNNSRSRPIRRTQAITNDCHSKIRIRVKRIIATCSNLLPRYTASDPDQNLPWVSGVLDDSKQVNASRNQQERLY